MAESENDFEPTNASAKDGGSKIGKHAGITENAAKFDFSEEPETTPSEGSEAKPSAELEGAAQQNASAEPEGAAERNAGAVPEETAQVNVDVEPENATQSHSDREAETTSGGEPETASASQQPASASQQSINEPQQSAGRPFIIPDTQKKPAIAIPKGSSKSSMTKVIVVIVVVAALLIGLLVGSLVLKGGSTNAAPASGGESLTGKTTVSESELESVIATYSLDGQQHDITVKQVIEQASSLEAMKNPDGNYQIPSADSVLTVARNCVLVADAEAKGITVSDEELKEYAQGQLGTSDYASIAVNYGMDSESVTNLLRESCLMAKLRESIMGDGASMRELPQPPSEPVVEDNARSSQSSSSSSYDEDDEYYDEDEENSYNEEDEESANSEEPTNNEGEASTAQSEEYANYIISLVGDEWDKAKGTWASTSGPYYQALSSYDITPQGATYDAALAAYYVAYQQYTASSTAVTEAWTDYVNSLLNKASISIYTLLA